MHMSAPCMTVLDDLNAQAVDSENRMLVAHVRTLPPRHLLGKDGLLRELTI